MILFNTRANLVPEKITVTAPARLHFGLFSVGDISERKFGGLGLMVEQPQTIVHCTPNDHLEITGAGSEDATKTVRSFFAKLQPELTSKFAISDASEFPCHLHIETIPPRHSGFGSGTQLALATASALSQSIGLPLQTPEDMAATLERGKRSAIGTYGFFRGGFLVDRGKLTDEILAPLDFQSDFPDSWKIVLLRLKNCQGFFGDHEVSAFNQLPPSSEQHRTEMIEMVKREIIPGVLQKNYDQFAEAIYQFGRRSGLMFASVQGGAYQSNSVADLVNQVRSFGVKGVGQSSWGPCVFAITQDDIQTNELTKSLYDCYGNDLEIIITKAANQGSQTSGELESKQSETNKCQHLE